MNLSLLALGASGLIILLVMACLVSWLGGFSWQEEQLHSFPCLVLKNCSPLSYCLAGLILVAL